MPKAASSSKKESDVESQLTTQSPSISKPGSSPPDSKYTVVARRYRPLDFSQLVGQSTVVQALTTAIQTNRVGHAYLFTGARGVGKTSSARIFAKALNASADGSGKFDPNSDVALAIDSGEDMDVLEIDGASNRGIDEIRQLRASVSARPSRSPYKIYIIDEVHMLTMQAFNALLKTLEEPPPHVKFIFCTTDPEKVPITVLSRCQRFDFSPVKTDQILERLQFICKNENATAEPEALQLIARRAAGSMRDSQSLLEQILSFADSKITTATVHAMLGTADESRLADISSALIGRDNALILTLLNDAVEDGVDAGQLGEQILGYLRDMMTIGVGASAELLRTANPTRADELRDAAKCWGTMTLLAAIQILDESLVKMRHSTQSRTLLEVAMVQICHLQDLQGLADLIRGLQAGKSPPMVDSISSASANTSETPSKTAASTVEKKKPDPIINEEIDVASNPSVDGITHLDPALEITPGFPAAVSDETLKQIPKEELGIEPADDNQFASDPAFTQDPMACWEKALKHVDGMVADYASMVVKIECSTNPATQSVKSITLWTALFPLGADMAMKHCNETSHRQSIEVSLQAVTNQPLQLTLRMSSLPAKLVPSAPKPIAPVANQPTLVRKYSEHPLVKSLVKSIDGDIVRVDVRT